MGRLGLEFIGDHSIVQGNFDKLEQLVFDTGGQTVGVRFGTGTLVFTASATSAIVTITHTLGAVPKIVLAFPYVGTDFMVMGAIAASLTATQFQVRGRTNGAGVTTENVDFFWIAIG